MRKLLTLTVALGSLILVSCGGGGYSGYMTRSYTIKGVRYNPMTVEEALSYDETGIASWYDESSFFWFQEGRFLAGRKGGAF